MIGGPLRRCGFEQVNGPLDFEPELGAQRPQSLVQKLRFEKKVGGSRTG
jgi:hypothetical protein